MTGNGESRVPATFPPGGHGADRGPRPQLLLALCGAGFLAFNFPLLMVWDVDATVFGLPLLPVALFAIWGVLVAALAVASERRPRAPGPALPARDLAPGDPVSDPVQPPSPAPAGDGG